MEALNHKSLLQNSITTEEFVKIFWACHVTEELLRLPFVRTVSQRAGRAERADDTWGTHYSELDVDLKPLKGEEGEFALVDIRKILVFCQGGKGKNQFRRSLPIRDLYRIQRHIRGTGEIKKGHIDSLLPDRDRDHPTSVTNYREFQ